MEKPFPAYQGKEPYVFVCYSHRDAETVYREISWLYGQGVNVWYDEGITPGVEWTEELASAIQGCVRFLFFVTPNSVASNHCRRELNFALAEGLDVAPIHLSRTDIPAGVRLSLNDRQAILKYELSAESYRNKLLGVSQGGCVDISMDRETTTRISTRKAWTAVATAILTLSCVVAGIWWWGARERSALHRDMVAATAPQRSSDPAQLRNSIAVLPFENLSPDPDNAFFAAGIHEEVLSQLARVRNVSVIARSSVMQYAREPAPASQVAAELNVTTILEGSVRFAGNRVRLSAQLVDGRTNTQLWSDSYDAQLNDIFGVQLDIAIKIAESLQTELSPTEQQSIGNPITRSPAAHALYLRALANMREVILSPGKSPAIHEDLTAATAIDPEFAAAHALRSFTHVLDAQLALQGGVRNRRQQERNFLAAERYAMRALQLDSSQIPALLALSTIDLHARRWDASLAKLEQAFRLAPNEPLLLVALGQRYVRRGRIEEGVSLLDRAVALNPLDASVHLAVGWDYAFAERWEDAKTRSREVIALEPELAQGYADLATFSAASEDFAVARSMAREARDRSPGPYQMLRIAWSLGRSGDMEGARAAYEAVQPQITGEADPYWLYWLHDAIGDSASAMGYLELAIQDNFPIEAVDILRSHFNSPFFDGVRDDPRFESTVALANSSL